MNIKEHIPNALTSSNLFTGCVGIVYLFNSNYKAAFYCVVISAIFDFLDGFSARLLKVNSELGKQLDSLADLISFGLLPSVLVYTWLEEIHSSSINYLAFLIAVFSALRLAKFNLDESQKDEFIGLNTPANTLFIVSLIFWQENNFLNSEIWLFTSYGLISLILISSFLLVSNLRFFSFKFKSFEWADNKVRYGFIFVSLLMLVILKEISIPLIVIGYILFSFLFKK